MADPKDPPRTPPRRPGQRIIRAADARDWQAGRTMLEEAKREAARIRAEAEQAADAERARGFEEGRRAGAAAAAALLAEVSERADALLQTMPEMLAEIVTLALERVLGEADQDELMRRAVALALGEARDHVGLTLHAAPGMVAKLQAMVDTETAASRRIEVRADPELTPDRCVLASPAGFVELGPRAQIDALRAGIRAAMEQR